MTVEKPDLNASDDDWHDYAKYSRTHLISALAPFLVQSFGYKDRYVKQRLNPGLGSTINAFTHKYDIYLRLFPRPEAGWPRETLVVARIGFKDVRIGHGRKLLTLLAKLASEIGYKYIAIESTNDESKAFANRFGLQPIKSGSDWIGSIEDVQQALGLAA